MSEIDRTQRAQQIRAALETGQGDFALAAELLRAAADEVLVAVDQVGAPRGRALALVRAALALLEDLPEGRNT